MLWWLTGWHFPCPLFSIVVPVFTYIKTKDGYITQQLIQPPMTIEQWGYPYSEFSTFPASTTPGFGFSVGLSHSGKVLAFGCVGGQCNAAQPRA